MIDWVQKLPDSLIAVSVSILAWVVFNYAVLAERAMDRYATAAVSPACLAAIDEHEASLVSPRSRAGAILGMPDLDILIDQVEGLRAPRLLSKVEKLGRCQCAIAAQGASLRFDYALHTASFRTYAPETISNFRHGVVDFVFSGACGRLPGEWR
jgi:hypothetical protein